MLEDQIVIFVTASSEQEAKFIGKHLVEQKFAACVNIINNISSIYVWKGDVCNDQEVLLIIKSRKNLLEKIVKLVKKLHSYEVPEVIALPILGGSGDYLQWMEESLI